MGSPISEWLAIQTQRHEATALCVLMTSKIVFLLVCFIIIPIASGCVWGKWEQILASKQNGSRTSNVRGEEAAHENPSFLKKSLSKNFAQAFSKGLPMPGQLLIPGQYSPEMFREEQPPEPLVTPGQYDLEAPKAKNLFILWVPYDYTPDYTWPVIFCYHGAGGSVTTWPFYQVTRGQGFIIVGMNYTKPASGRRDRQWLSGEKTFFFEALAIVSARLSVDPEMVFMGGYSQGGYHTTLLGEQMLDRIAGLIILGAGRFFIDHTPPSMRLIHNKPIFIGVGENDSVHNPRARKAAKTYKLWGADVTFEEWPGVGHGINSPEFPSKILLTWLERIFAGPASL